MENRLGTQLGTDLFFILSLFYSPFTSDNNNNNNNNNNKYNKVPSMYRMYSFFIKVFKLFFGINIFIFYMY
jgi:hypothetical protein